MPSPSARSERLRLRTLSRRALEARQLNQLNDLLARLRSDNAFYAAKLADAPQRLESLAELPALPLTTKEELLPAPGELSSRNRTYPIEAYARFHQTSGTRGRPMPVLDTPQDWAWWVRCWQYVLDAAEVTAEDRAVLAFSFGPFVGFWSAFDAVAARGALAIPAGGMSSDARVRLIEQTGATLLLATPTYALHLADHAAEQGARLADLPVSRVVVAGEPGGSAPAVRRRLEQAWGARVIDHSGATEVGAWGYGDPGGAGLRIIESEFLPEFLDIETGEPLRGDDPKSNGRQAHLVLTTLGRHGAPVLRYRTGDLVRPRWDAQGEVHFVYLEGGVLGRIDDMMVVRGVNVFPSAIDQILHGFPEVVEHRTTVRKSGEMDQLVIEVEDKLERPERISKELELRLGLKVQVRLAPAMSLPRSDHKAHRFVDLRNPDTSTATGP